jgi:1,4-alpha-glucan branching enzyme
LVDGEAISDLLNPLTIRNENGGNNSILLLPSKEGNVEFILKGYNTAKTVALAGTFNDWSSRRHIFFRQGDQWICRIRLKQGSYKYKFVVDGEWILDPANKQIVENEFHTGNNVLTVK